MNERSELRTWLCATLALAACLALAPRTALAQGAGRAPDQGPRVAVRAYYLWDSFSSSESALGVDTFSTVSFHGKPGGGIDAEYLFTPWVGLDFGASQTHVEADEVTRLPVGPSFQNQGKIQQRFFMLGLYGHFYRVQRLDVYIGPLVGADEMTGSFRPNKTTFAFGAALGLDLPLGSTGLAISGVGRVLSSRFPDQFRSATHFRDNYMVGGGLAYRF
jgi:hypothetical protein